MRVALAEDGPELAADSGLLAVADDGHERVVKGAALIERVCGSGQAPTPFGAGAAGSSRRQAGAHLVPDQIQDWSRRDQPESGDWPTD
ncbi:MAG: hypothetical protein U0556_14890 [Dehalococcoidia bacterium]